MHRRVSELKEMYTRIERMHRIVYGLMIQIRDDLSASDLKQEDRVDLSYLLRETSRMFKDLEKEARLLRESNDNIVCFKAMTKSTVDKISGDIATGTPDLKMIAKLPKHGTPEFMELMDDLGINKEVVGLDAVRPHYPGLVELISQRMAAGSNPPRGIDPTTTHPKYSLILRKKAGVDL